MFYIFKNLTRKRKFIRVNYRRLTLNFPFRLRQSPVMEANVKDRLPRFIPHNFYTDRWCHVMLECTNQDELKKLKENEKSLTLL